MSLGVCGGCGRFAHFGAGCPFCGGAISAPKARKGGRRTRNGMLAAAIAAAACGGTTTDGKDASVDAKDDYMAAPPYGAPAYGIVPVDGGLDSGRDSGPVDSGVDAPKDASDEG